MVLDIFLYILPQLVGHNMMSKELIEKRKTDLIQGLEQKRAEMNAFVGAIQDCDYWLSELSKTVEE